MLQAAVEMADAEMEYGSSSTLSSLATQISNTQTAQIAELRAVLSMTYAMTM